MVILGPPSKRDFLTTSVKVWYLYKLLGMYADVFQSSSLVIENANAVTGLKRWIRLFSTFKMVHLVPKHEKSVD